MHVAGPDICIREVCADDEVAITRLIEGLDAESRRRRWFTGGVDIHRAAAWAAHPDRATAVGLLALAADETVGHAVLIARPDGSGEVAFEVAAAWRQHGIAGSLLVALLEAAGTRGLRAVYADVLPDNSDMLAVMREHGEHRETRADGIVTITLPVPRQAAAHAPSSSPSSSA